MTGTELIPGALEAMSKDGGVLKALYKDLASPGVRQVGRALATILETGSLVLLPLRMLNHKAAQIEKRNFSEIAKRFAEIPDDRVIKARPEIAVPALERMSYTEDPDLRKMFIELLAAASDANRVKLAHPNFVKVIESLSPTEAKILSSWGGARYVPCISIARKSNETSSTVFYKAIYEYEDESVDAVTLSALLSNMEGLGLVKHREMDSLDREKYDSIIDDVKKSFPDIKRYEFSFLKKEKGEINEGDFYYQEGVIEILDFGIMFASCCIEQKQTT